MPPNFYKRMTLVCSKIPYGKAATYGQIALLCGMPKNSRQVGYALRTGKAGEHVPAHRIVNAKVSIPDSFTPSFRGMETDVPICKKP